MHLKSIVVGSALMAGAVAAHAQAVPADHLLISEMLINSATESLGGSAEYVEIFNPTDNAVSLAQYFITDDDNYYNYPTVVNDGLESTINDLGNNDFMWQFPATASIPSGGVVVVVHSSNALAKDFFNNDISNFFSQTGSPQLFECLDSDPSVPNMRNHNTTPVAADASNFSHTNSNEFNALFYWDQNSDLVQDVDLVSYGSAGGTNFITQRDGQLEEGPNNDGTFGAYKRDGGIDGQNIDYEPGFDPNMIVRRSTIELGESGTDGNGITGHDETMEWNWDTWVGDEGDAPGEDFNSPGTTELVKNSDGPIPFVGAISRSEQYPTLNSTFNITCAAGAVTAPNVTLNYNTGSGFQTKPMTLNVSTQLYEAEMGPYTTNTYIQYFIEATAGGKTGRSPLIDGLHYRYFGDYYGIHVEDTQVGAEDVKFNEFMLNPNGSPNGGRQWVELYNTRATPVDISGYFFSDYKSNSERCRIPDGAIIPPNGFLILGSSKDGFLIDYPEAVDPTWDPDLVFNVIDQRTAAAPYPNLDTDTPSLAHANAYRWNNRPSVIFETIEYFNNNDSGNPWPYIPGGSPDGPSLELKSPTLDNTQGENWAASINPYGSPLAANQQSVVADWSVY